MSVEIRELSDVGELGRLRPLWLALHHHHHAVSQPELLVADDAASWARRRAVYEEWLRAGSAIVLVAELAPLTTVGYLVARICAGPDDTFAVGDRYAELYSLSVAPAYRGRRIGTALLDALDERLDAFGIGALTVAVMGRQRGRAAPVPRTRSDARRGHPLAPAPPRALSATRGQLRHDPSASRGVRQLTESPVAGGNASDQNATTAEPELGIGPRTVTASDASPESEFAVVLKIAARDHPTHGNGASG